MIRCYFEIIAKIKKFGKIFCWLEIIQFDVLFNYSSEISILQASSAATNWRTSAELSDFQKNDVYEFGT